MRTLLAVVTTLALTGVAPAQQKLKQADTEIAFTVRILTVRDDLFERAEVDLSKPLTDEQLKLLLETVQGDRSTNVMQFPKVTLLNGQEATVRSTEKRSFVTGLEATRVNGAVTVVPKTTEIETGVTLVLQGKVSADGKSIRTRFDYKDAQIEEMVEMVPITTQGKATQYLQVPRVATVTIDKSDLAIQSGGHVVIPGPAQMREERREFGPPVMSKIPYVNRLFKNVGIGREAVRTYLVVSPMIVTAPQ